jgi:hypothetical protein
VLIGYLVLLFLLPVERPPGLRLRNLIIFFSPGVVVCIFLLRDLIQKPSTWLELFGWVNNNPVWLLAGLAYYIDISVICMAIFGGLYLLIKKSRIALLLGLGAVVPILAILLLSLVQFSANRYAFVALTSWIILAAVAIKELYSQTQGLTRLLVGGVILTLFALPLSEDMMYYQYQNGNRDNWKAAYALVKQNKSATDVVVTANPLLANYYLEEPIIGMEALELSRIDTLGDRVWFVEDMNVEPKWPQVSVWLQENAELVANLDVHVRARNFKMRVYRYEPINLSATQISKEE